MIGLKNNRAMTIHHFQNRQELYQFFENQPGIAGEFYIYFQKGNPEKAVNVVSYLDAVEVALCFGYIDSVFHKNEHGCYGRFSPRKAKSPWTELNKERCRRLIKRGEMKPSGLAVCPDLNASFVEPIHVVKELQKNKEAYEFFRTTPALYQRIRLYNVEFYRLKDKKQYQISLTNLINHCLKKELYGEWNDYGRLLNY